MAAALDVSALEVPASPLRTSFRRRLPTTTSTPTTEEESTTVLVDVENVQVKMEVEAAPPPAVAPPPPHRRHEAPKPHNTLEPSSFAFDDPDGVPIFRPTIDEFDDFNSLIKRVEWWGRQRGLVKIVAPSEWLAQLDASKYQERLAKITIRHPIQQHISGQGGVYRQLNQDRSGTWSFADWTREAFSPSRLPPLEEFLEDSDPSSPSSKRRRTARGRVDVVNTNPVPIKGKGKENKTIEEKGNVAVSNNSSSQPSSSSSQQQQQTTSTTTGKALKRARDAAPNWVHSILDPTETDLATPNPSTDSSSDPSQKRSSKRPDLPSSAYTRLFSTLPSLYPPESIPALEKKYWRTLTSSEPLYGADLTGTLMGDVKFDKGDSWNLNRLGGEGNVLNGIKKGMPGVNRPYLYFGTWKATFGWHLEDVDLYSINYLHFGAPKHWYVIPPPLCKKFEKLSKELFSAEMARCDQFLRHKAVMISPAFLEQKGFGRDEKAEKLKREYEKQRARLETPESLTPDEQDEQEEEEVRIQSPSKAALKKMEMEEGQGKVLKLVQEQGEFVVTWPYGYHAGFNLGLNCAESVNFATPEWIDIGRRAKFCSCAGDTVRIDVVGLLGGQAKLEELEEKRRVKREKKEKRKAEKLERKGKRERKVKEGKKKEKDRKVVDTRKCELCPAPPTFDTLLPIVDWMPEDPAPPMDKRKWCHRTCALFIPECTVMDVPDFDWKERKKREREERERVEMLVMAAALAGEEGGKEEEGVVAAGSVEAEAPAPVVVAPVVAAPAVAPIVAPIVAPAAEEEEPLIEIVVGVSQIPKDRFRLKCYICKNNMPRFSSKWAARRSTRGACIQCCKGKCTRAVHVSCARTSNLWLETYWEPWEYLDEVSGETIVEEMERGRCWCGMHDPRKEEEKKRAREEAEEMLVSKLEGGTPVWVKMGRQELIGAVVVSVDKEAKTVDVRYLEIPDQDEEEQQPGEIDGESVAAPPAPAAPVVPIIEEEVHTVPLKDVELREEEAPADESATQDDDDDDDESGDEDEVSSVSSEDTDDMSSDSESEAGVGTDAEEEEIEEVEVGSISGLVAIPVPAVAEASE